MKHKKRQRRVVGGLRSLRAAAPGVDALTNFKQTGNDIVRGMKAGIASMSGQVILEPGDITLDTFESVHRAIMGHIAATTDYTVTPNGDGTFTHSFEWS